MLFILMDRSSSRGFVGLLHRFAPQISSWLEDGVARLMRIGEEQVVFVVGIDVSMNVVSVEVFGCGLERSEGALMVLHSSNLIWKCEGSIIEVEHIIIKIARRAVRIHPSGTLLFQSEIGYN